MNHDDLAGQYRLNDRDETPDIVHIESDDMRSAGQAIVANENRISIRWTLGGRLNAEHSAGTAFVLDHDRLADRARDIFRDEARHEIKSAASDGRHDESYGTHWIGLRHRETRDSWERYGTSCQMQKSSAGKFHFHHSPIPLVRAPGA